MSHNFFSIFKKIIQNQRKQNILKQEREDTLVCVTVNSVDSLGEGKETGTVLIPCCILPIQVMERHTPFTNDRNKAKRGLDVSWAAKKPHVSSTSAWVGRKGADSSIWSMEK